ncbi:MAG: DEAD/DEAH box helicase family protein [Ignisphaera sp.]|nr:DEAD/DEAH box helicase family protein [Ignisphaera sp.]
MKPYNHQIAIAEQATAILKEYMLVYLAMEERTGKTLTAILVAEQVQVERILVITKKKALPGWHETIAAYKPSKHFEVTNYHQVEKLTGSYDLVIIDEAHSYISGYPKTSKMWSSIKAVAANKPIIYLSATPYAQGYQLLYHQFAISSWSPWRKYKNFYQWFAVYGIAKSLYANGRQIPQYNTVKPEVFDTVSHLFITKTRKELDFEHEPEDIVHYIELLPETKQLYNKLVEERMVKIGDLDLVCDTTMKLRTSLHMLEGGVAKIDTTYLVLPNNEKVDFILANFGDSPDVVIMYQYIAEETKLKAAFKHATILQATSYAEGVDLSGYAHLIIYSQDWSTARHSQRRARQANMARKTPIKVHFLLSSKAISEQVYTAVAKNKVNYIDSLYSGELL